MKKIITTNSNSIAIIDYCVEKISTENDLIIVGNKIRDITFYEDNYYHSAYKISFTYYKLINDEIKKLLKYRKKVTKDDYKKNYDLLPF